MHQPQLFKDSNRGELYLKQTVLFPYNAQTHTAEHLETFSSKWLSGQQWSYRFSEFTSRAIPWNLVWKEWCRAIFSSNYWSKPKQFSWHMAQQSKYFSFLMKMILTINFFVYHWNIFIVHLIYWVVQWSWFARVNALCNLSHKKSRKVAAVNARPISE